LLVEMMAEFYAESGYAFEGSRAHAAFAHLLSDESLGRVWLLRAASEAAGYIVLTLGYSMEYGGRDAFVDDLYVRPAYRGRGLGSLALNTLRDACMEAGVRAIHLEVSHGNEPALVLYHRAGFESNDRRLLTLRLDDPNKRR
jgi:ribosomal protein S18 acetylase RimI-like enzyme